MYRLRYLACFVLACGTLASVCHAGPPPASDNPPERIDVTFTLDPLDPSVGTSACTFPVEISITGKSKVISLPGNRLIITAPGQNATVTNVNDRTKQVKFNITGVFTVMTQPDGGEVDAGTGRNLTTDPYFGLTLVIGHFSFAFDKDGNLIQGLTLQGGQAISVCSLID